MYISSIDPESDAAQKGLEAGDILVSVENTRISNMEELNALLSNYEVGDSVRTIIYRGGVQYSVQLTLHESKGY